MEPPAPRDPPELTALRDRPAPRAEQVMQARPARPALLVPPALQERHLPLQARPAPPVLQELKVHPVAEFNTKAPWRLTRPCPAILMRMAERLVTLTLLWMIPIFGFGTAQFGWITAHSRQSLARQVLLVRRARPARRQQLPARPARPAPREPLAPPALPAQVEQSVTGGRSGTRQIRPHRQTPPQLSVLIRMTQQIAALAL